MAQNNDSPGKRLKREEAKNTLYVSRPDDPRLQRYRDSLAIFNNNTELVNQLKNLGYSPDPVQKSNKFIAKSYLEQLEKDYKNPKTKEYLDKRGYKHNKISKTLEEISDLVPGNINHQLKLQLASKEIQPAGTQAWTKWGIFNDDWIPTFDARTAFDYSNVKPKRIVEYRPEPPKKESFATKKIVPVQRTKPKPIIERKVTEIVEPLAPRQSPSPILTREEIIAPVPRPVPQSNIEPQDGPMGFALRYPAQTLMNRVMARITGNPNMPYWVDREGVKRYPSMGENSPEEVRMMETLRGGLDSNSPEDVSELKRIEMLRKMSPKDRRKYMDSERIAQE